LAIHFLNAAYRHGKPIAAISVWPSPLQHMGEDPAEAQAPLTNALVTDDDPACPRISSTSRRLRLNQ
jgi:hypothetical protein